MLDQGQQEPSGTKAARIYQSLFSVKKKEKYSFERVPSTDFLPSSTVIRLQENTFTMWRIPALSVRPSKYRCMDP